MSVRVGILGTGKIAQDFARSLSLVGEATIVAVGSRSKESAVRFGQTLNLTDSQCYESYESLANADGIDLIYVASPHSFHYEHVILCLNNNKNVICEKALALSSVQVEAMIKLAREKNLFLMEAFWTRYNPLYVYLRDEILPKIGPVHLARAAFGFENPGVPRLTEPELGGGAILDIGVYSVNFCSIAFQDKEVKQIIAQGNVDENHIDHEISATLVFDNDGQKGFGQIFCSIEADTPSEALIVGKNGSVKVHDPFWCATKVTIKMKGEEEFVKEFNLPNCDDNDKYNFTNSVLLHHEARYACQQILKGNKESEVFGLDDSLRIMKILDEIRNQLAVSYPNEGI